MRVSLVAGLAVLALAGVPSDLAAASSISARRYSADAFFSSTVGCTRTFVGVFPVAVWSGRGNISGASMNVQVDAYDTCSHEPLVQAGSGVLRLTSDEFVLQPGLTGARMRSSAPLHDSVSGKDFVVTINLDYVSTTPRSCARQTASDETIIFCGAVVSGAVVSGGTNYTPEPGQAVFQEHRP